MSTPPVRGVQLLRRRHKSAADLWRDLGARYLEIRLLGPRRARA